MSPRQHFFLYFTHYYISNDSYNPEKKLGFSKKGRAISDIQEILLRVIKKRNFYCNNARKDRVSV